MAANLKLPSVENHSDAAEMTIPIRRMRPDDDV